MLDVGSVQPSPWKRTILRHWIVRFWTTVRKRIPWKCICGRNWIPLLASFAVKRQLKSFSSSYWVFCRQFRSWCSRKLLCFPTEIDDLGTLCHGKIYGLCRATKKQGRYNNSAEQRVLKKDREGLSSCDTHSIQHSMRFSRITRGHRVNHLCLQILSFDWSWPPRHPMKTMTEA